jgi:hypothetical protein
LEKERINICRVDPRDCPAEDFPDPAGKAQSFSLEKLCNLLTLLGRDVDIVIKDRKQGGVGHFRVPHA